MLMITTVNQSNSFILDIFNSYMLALHSSTTLTLCIAIIVSTVHISRPFSHLQFILILSTIFGYAAPCADPHREKIVVKSLIFASSSSIKS